jgi:hypothetical protein
MNCLIQLVPIEGARLEKLRHCRYGHLYVEGIQLVVLNSEMLPVG